MLTTKVASYNNKQMVACVVFAFLWIVLMAVTNNENLKREF